MLESPPSPPCSPSGSVPVTSLLRVCSGILLGTERGAPGQREWKESGAALKTPSGAGATLTSPEGIVRLALVASSHAGSRGQRKKRHREGGKCVIHDFLVLWIPRQYWHLLVSMLSTSQVTMLPQYWCMSVEQVSGSPTWVVHNGSLGDDFSWVPWTWQLPEKQTLLSVLKETAMTFSCID